MRRLAAYLTACVFAFLPAGVSASQWGSDYGDPAGFCPEQSYLPSTYAVVATNDPLVGTNPERDTFWGWHANPGYDDWFGRWYGDFRGRPEDDSGWIFMFRDRLGEVMHWNFADYGWAVHGHAKQYIAYYNWTFGGSCAMGRYGSTYPAPYMADVLGFPVVDIYVDSTPPYPPEPRVTDLTTTSVAFSWDPVADRGDGVGRDYWASGMDHYSSWLTVGGGPALQYADTSSPRTLTASNLAADQAACVHVRAVDRLGNATGDQQRCSRPLHPPELPDLGLDPGQVNANPAPKALVGLESWFWLDPRPRPKTVEFDQDGLRYRVTATPAAAGWDFGDGSRVQLHGDAAFGQPYPARSTVTHTYQTHSEPGYLVGAAIEHELSWWVQVSGSWQGPYPMPSISAAAIPLRYPAAQAQPELLGVR